MVHNSFIFCMLYFILHKSLRQNWSTVHKISSFIEELSLFSGLCTLVTCMQYKICTEFVLQVTNVQGLGTRLGRGHTVLASDHWLCSEWFPWQCNIHLLPYQLVVCCDDMYTIITIVSFPGPRHHACCKWSMSHEEWEWDCLQLVLTRSRLEETYKTVEYCKRSYILLSCTVAKLFFANFHLKPTQFYHPMFSTSTCKLALFPGLPWLQFLIACSMQKPEPGKAWERG